MGGCEYGDSDDPGNLQFDWLEVQLDRYRDRGMQVRGLDFSIGFRSSLSIISVLSHCSRYFLLLRVTLVVSTVVIALAQLPPLSPGGELNFLIWLFLYDLFFTSFTTPRVGRVFQTLSEPRASSSIPFFP